MTARPESPAPTESSSEAPGAAPLSLSGVLFALSAATAYATAQVITKRSVTDVTSPLVGTFIALLWGTLGFSLLATRELVRSHRTNLARGLRLFALGGFFSAMGVLLMFFALAQGQVVVVAPVLATNPLFTLLFAFLLLRGVERITPRIVLGALLVVAGVVTLSVF